MPYITCPDGKTYSRYDQSTYVKWCICEENKVNDSIYKIKQQKYNECTLDPYCLEKRNNLEFKQNFIIISILILILYFIYKFIKSF